MDKIIAIIKSETKPIQVRGNHHPTDGELNNLAYLSMKYLAGFAMVPVISRFA